MKLFRLSSLKTADQLHHYICDRSPVGADTAVMLALQAAAKIAPDLFTVELVASDDPADTAKLVPGLIA